jgi:hypothetical protein
MLKLKLTAVALALGLAAFSLATGDGFSLKRTQKAGTVHKYKQEGKFEVGGQQIDYQSKSTQKIVKVGDDGGYVEESVSSDVTINGQEPPGGGAAVTTTTKYSPKGEILEVKGENIDATAYRFANLSLFITPDTEVKAGDSWTYDIKEDNKTGAVAAKATFTLVGEDKVGGVDTLKIKFSIKETGTDGASSEGTAWLDKSDLSMVKVSAKWTNAPVPGAPVTISGDITITVIS